MIAACLYAATLPAFLCTPNIEPPPPPPARVVAADHGKILSSPPPPRPEPEVAPRTLTIERPHLHAEEPEPEPEPESASGIPEPWYSLAVCESGMGGVPRWDYNGGSGFDGGIQFHPNTWTAFGGGEYASEAWQATPHQQIEIGKRVLAEQGWGAWPSCSSKLGLR